MTALDPSFPDMGAEAPSPKWSGERVAFITEQYLTYRKSAGEIARMLGPAFTRNSVAGKLFRTGALQARSGIGLGDKHGLPRGRQLLRTKVPIRSPVKKGEGRGDCASGEQSQGRPSPG